MPHAVLVECAESSGQLRTITRTHLRRRALSQRMDPRSVEWEYAQCDFCGDDEV